MPCAGSGTGEARRSLGRADGRGAREARRPRAGHSGGRIKEASKNDNGIGAWRLRARVWSLLVFSRQAHRDRADSARAESDAAGARRMRVPWASRRGAARVAVGPTREAAGRLVPGRAPQARRVLLRVGRLGRPCLEIAPRRLRDSVLVAFTNRERTAGGRPAGSAANRRSRAGGPAGGAANRSRHGRRREDASSRAGGIEAAAMVTVGPKRDRGSR